MADFEKSPREVNKKLPEVTVAEHDASESVSHSLESDWQPGFWNRFPWIGLGALATALVCCIGELIVLVTSNGKSVTQWPQRVAPNVLLSALNSVANIGFSVAIGNGIAIAWWRQTLQGATIKQLQRSWAFSTSLVQIAKSCTRLNFIALAAITTKLLIIDSVLMQRATTTTVRPDHPILLTNITGFANQTLPFTGQMTGRNGIIGFLEPYFNQDLKIWAQSGGLLPNNFNGCNGLCFMQVPAAGFAFDCSEPKVTHNDIGNSTMEALEWILNHNCSGTPLPAICSSPAARAANAALVAPMFTLTFTPVDDNVYAGPGINTSINPYAQTSYVQMDVAYVATETVGETCPGTMTTQTCKLLPAVVNYPVQVQNYNTAHLIPNVQLGLTQASYLGDSSFKAGDFNITLKQQNGFEILSYRHINEGISGADAPNAVMRGIAAAFNSYLNANASLRFDGAVGYFADQESSALQWLKGGPADNTAGCNYTYFDPIANNSAISVPSVIQRINEIMFILATDMSNMDPRNDKSAVSTYNATVYLDRIHYESHYGFMWGAFATTLVCMLCVLPVYWGFWELGRKVTLGPFEIAAAFRSPLINSGTVDQIIEESGRQQVQYGHIVSGDAAGRIAIAEPQYVEGMHQPRPF